MSTELNCDLEKEVMGIARQMILDGSHRKPTTKKDIFVVLDETAEYHQCTDVQIFYTFALQEHVFHVGLD